MKLDLRIALVFALGYLAVAYAPARASDQSIDRALVERLVRAVESVARATERCR